MSAGFLLCNEACVLYAYVQLDLGKDLKKFKMKTLLSFHFVESLIAFTLLSLARTLARDSVSSRQLGPCSRLHLIIAI